MVYAGTQGVSVQALETATFDTAADACWEYFIWQGYSNLAGLMAGKNSTNGTVLGAGFCANVDFDLGGSESSAAGLPLLLKPTPYGSCQPHVYYDYDNGGTRITGLTGFDRAVLVSESWHLHVRPSRARVY